MGILPRFLNYLRFNTTFALHNKATKVAWYKKWHDKKFSHYAHVAVLLVYVSSIFFAAFILPNRLYAALTEQNQQISSQAQFELGTLNGSSAGIGNAVRLSTNSFNNYNYKKQLNFNTSVTGADVATNQQNFPIVVHINASSWANATERANFFGAYNTNGKRIRFYDADGVTNLSYEVEYYNSAATEAIYWVKVPQINSNSTSDSISIYYGNDPYGIAQDSATSVWDASTVGTWLFNERSGTTINNHTSTSGINAPFGGSPAWTNTGPLGRSVYFNGSSYATVPTNAALSTNNITLQALVKYNSWNGFQNWAVSREWSSWSQPYYQYSIGTDGNYPYSYFGVGSSLRTAGNSSIGTGEWHLLTFTYNGTNGVVYKDGVAGTPTAVSGSLNQAATSLNFARRAFSPVYSNVDIAFISMSNTARSADWIKLTSYTMQKTSWAGDSMLTWLAEQQPTYSSTGSYVSPANQNVLDMNWIGDGSWLTANPNFQATVNIPANTSINFSARVGRDNAGSIVWDGTAGVGGWVDLGTADSTGTFVGSNTVWDSMPDNLDGYSWRYVQIQAEFTSDGSDTPTLSDYTVTYGTDITDPINPTASRVYTDSGKGTELTSNVSWTNDVTPYLEWTGASDGVGDSGINCFYVYLGTDINADPETAGMEVSGNSCHSGTNLDLLSVDTNPLADAVTGDIYYLRIDTKDNAGNIADMPNGQAVFTYKFDDTDPTSPTAANKSPIGYSSTNSYSFDWTDYVGTDDFSNIAKYQYKTGNPGATWVDFAGTSFTNLALLPIVNGKNTIYIRAVDNAGNVSENPADWYRDYFYYSANAPSKPTYLTVTPNSNTENAFNFKWYKPFDYTADGIKGYRYSINVPPSANNSVYFTDPDPTGAPPVEGEGPSGIQMSTGAIPAATKQDTNVFYVVAVDTSDAVNYNNFAEVSFDASTTAPGIPGSASISDSSNRESSQWSLTTAWNPSSGSVNHYNVYRSSNGTDWPDNPSATTDSTGYFDSGLTQAEIYYYYITAVDNAGSESAPSTIVFDEPTGKYTTPPSIVSGPEATATAVGARITWSTDRPSSSFAEYSTDTSYNLSNGSLTPKTEHVVELSGLIPSNTYNFRVQSLDEERDYDPSEAYSQNYTLATSAAPGISEVKVSDTGLYSTIVTWKTTSSATSRIKYGLTTSYGQEVVDESGSAVTTHTVKIGDLRHSTNYNFKITGIDIDNNYMESDNYVFSTLTFPTVSNVRFEQQKNTTTSTLKVTWDSNVPLTSVVGYRLADGGATMEESSSKLVVKHEMMVAGLKDNTTYYMAVEGRDAHGNLAISDQNKVQTDFDTRPPEIFNVSTETEVTGYGLDSKGQIIVSWETDEPGTSQIEYGVGSGGAYTNKTQEDSALSTSHVVIVSELKTSSPYHFRVISNDASKNEGKSEEYSALTLQANRSVFDAILNALEGAIGWLFR